MSLVAESSTSLESMLFTNSALILVCRVVALSFSLVSVPFVIRSLGFEGYGTWEALMAVAAISTIPQNVTGGTLLWRMSSAFGAGDAPEIIRLTRLGVTFTMASSAVSLPVVWVFRKSLVSLLNIPGPFQDTSHWILPAVVALMLLGGVTESLGSVIRGCQSAGITVAIQTVASVLNGACAIGALLLGAGLWSLLLGFLLSFAVTGVAFYIVASRVCHGITLRPQRPSAGDLRTVRKYASCLLLGTMSASLRTETDKIVLASLASPTWTGYYGLAARLASLVMEASNFFYVPTIAAVGAMHARGDWQGIRALYSKLMVAVPLAAGCVVVILAGLPQHIMMLWIGKYVPEVFAILGVLLAGYAAAVILTGPGTCICKAIGKIEVETAYLAVSLILNLSLTIGLVGMIGAFGTVIATAVSWTIGAILFTFLFHRRIDISSQPTRRAARCFIALPLVIVAARSLPFLRSPHGGRWTMLIELPAAAILVTLLFAGTMFVLGVVSRRSCADALKACSLFATTRRPRFVLARQLGKRETELLSTGGSGPDGRL